jgi:hypothetical protein
MVKGINFFNSGNEIMRIDSNGHVGIGISTPKGGMRIEEYVQWREIVELAETNPAVKIALDKLMTVYYLSKESQDTKTLDW